MAFTVCFAARAAEEASPTPPPQVAAQTDQDKKPWILLDPYTARHTRAFFVGLSSYRRTTEEDVGTAYALGFGEGVTTVRNGFLAGGRVEHELRFVPSKTATLSLARYAWEGGLRLGPVEPIARVGFTMLNVEFGDQGFGFGMFAPRAGAGVFVKVGKLSFGLAAFTEYAFRWVGTDSAFLRGITLELHPEVAPLRTRKPPPKL